MKKSIIGFLFLFFAITFISGQSQVYFDFDEKYKDFQIFGTTSFDTTVNPNTTGINSSSIVGHTISGGEEWDGMYTDFHYGFFDFSSDTTFSLKVLSGIAGTVNLKLESPRFGTNPIEVSAEYSGTGTWEELSFPFTNPPNDTYSRIVLFFDYGEPVSDVDWYFDDLTGPAFASDSTVGLFGILTENTVWSDTVRISGLTTVANNTALLIEPGTYIEFQGPFSLDVWGTLLAEGEPGDSITFTVHDSTGYHDMADTAGGWGGIRFDNSDWLHGANWTMLNSDTSRISHCKFQFVKNLGTNYYSRSGGAIFVNFYSKVVITHSLFIHNQNNWGGGAITLVANSDIRISDNTFLYNRGPKGGAIWSEESSPYIVNNLFSFNESFNFDYNLGGGAINCRGHTPTIISNEISHNEASQGGGIFCWESKALIRDNIITYNVARDEGWGGGGIHLTGGSDPVIVNNKIANNSANNGGGLRIIDSAPELFNNLIVNNTAKSGGAFSFTSVGPKLINNTIARNHASEHGGALHLVESPPLLINNLIWGNTSPNGSQVHIVDSYSKAEFRNCLVEGGTAAFKGSAFSGIYENCIDLDPLIVNPSASSGTGTDGLSGNWELQDLSPCINAGENDIGYLEMPETDLAGHDRIKYDIIDIGAYEVHIQSLTISDTLSNDTILIADTIKIESDIVVPDDVTLEIAPGTLVEFQGFYWIYVMGTLLAEGTENEPVVFTIADTTGFSDLSTEQGGWIGIIFNNGIDGANGGMDDNDTSRLDHCIIEYTKCKEDEERYYYQDGAIYLGYFSRFILSNSIIQNNYGNYAGGVNCYLSGPVIRNNIFRYNETWHDGGAIYANTGSVITDNYIHNNKAKHKGGGISAHNGTIIKDNIIERNTAIIGGGICCSRDRHLIVNNLITNNSAEGGGAGINVESARPEIINNQITNNHSDASSGALHIIYVDRGLVMNNTIANNSGNDGIHISTSHPDFVNNIIWGNGHESVVQVSIAGNSNPDFTNCLIQDSEEGFLIYKHSNFGGELENIIDTIPEFVMPSLVPGIFAEGISFDYSLLPTSSCINAGILTDYEELLPATDLNSNPRIFWEQVDLGAYEDQSGLPEFTRHPSGDITCKGDSLTMSVSTRDYANIQWMRDGEMIAGLDKDIWKVDSLMPSDQGSYLAVASNSYGTVKSNSALVIVKSAPEILVEPVDSWEIPGELVKLRVDVRGSDPLYYEWLKDSLVIDNGSFPEYKINAADHDDEGVYICKVSNSCGQAETTPVSLYMAPQICMVTVDPATGNNLVVWEKNSGAPIEFFNVYRESNYAGIFDLLATVPYDNLSIVLDSAADPTSRAYIYKVTGVDSSGNETDIDLCLPHKTIHLLVTANPETKATQLDWDRYVGFEYGTYLIYRSDTTYNFTELDQMSSSTSTWADPDPGTSTNYYRIAALKPDPCIPTGNIGKKADTGPYSHAMSNVEDNRLQGTGTADLPGADNRLGIYPNPAKAHATIEFSNPEGKPYTMYLKDITGKVCRIKEHITSSEIYLETGDLAAGLYLIELTGPDKHMGRLVIE